MRISRLWPFNSFGRNKAGKTIENTINCDHWTGGSYKELAFFFFFFFFLLWDSEIGGGQRYRVVVCIGSFFRTFGYYFITELYPQGDGTSTHERRNQSRRRASGSARGCIHPSMETIGSVHGCVHGYQSDNRSKLWLPAEQEQQKEGSRWLCNEPFFIQSHFQQFDTLKKAKLNSLRIWESQVHKKNLVFCLRMDRVVLLWWHFSDRFHQTDKKFLFNFSLSQVLVDFLGILPIPMDIREKQTKPNSPNAVMCYSSRRVAVVFNVYRKV